LPTRKLQIAPKLAFALGDLLLAVLAVTVLQEWWLICPFTAFCIP